MNIQPISEGEAQKIAEDFIQKQGWLARTSGLPVTDVETMALRAGYQVTTMPGLGRICSTWGVGYYNVPEARYMILIDEDSYANHYQSAQFTIAEELGHYLAHFPLIKNIKSLLERINFEKSLANTPAHLIIESQAKKVASSLLLPAKYFDPYSIGFFAQHLSSLRGSSFPSEAKVAERIATDLAPALTLSQEITERALLRKLPNTVTSVIIQKFGLIIP
jgi:hypothetical protein